MAYTVFIRRIGLVYSDEEDEHSVPIDSDEITKTASLERKPRGQRIQQFRRRRKTQNPLLSTSDDSESDAIIQTIQHTTRVIPSTPPTTQILDQYACISIPASASSHDDSLRPTRVASVTRKRSLTMLSPENITTRSTRELKKVAPMEGAGSDASAGNTTEIDNDFGFQFLNNVD